MFIVCCVLYQNSNVCVHTRVLLLNYLDYYFISK